MKDYLIRGASNDGGVRFFCCTSTNIVEEARRIHDTYPVCTAALGRLLTAGSLMGTMLKADNDKLTLQVKGNGPAGGALVVSDNTGNVRGYINNPHVEIDLKPSGKLDVGGAIGYEGYLTVIKDLGLKEPYIGQIPLISGEIGDDLTVYYANSEQVPTSVGLGVLVDVDGSVRAAGGFILQVMPEAEEEIISSLEYNLARMRPITEMVDHKLSPEEVMKEILKEIEFTVLERKDISYKCNCDKDRIEKALISIGEVELVSMIEEQGHAEVVCHFCNHKYQFDKKDLTDLLERAKS